MAVPKYDQIMLPLLRHLNSDDGEVNVATVMPRLAKEFGLSDEQLQLRLPSGKQTYFANRCHWAKFYLLRAGLLENTRRGYFRITPDGRKTLASNPTSIDRDYLLQLPKFNNWWHLESEKSRNSDVGLPANDPLDAKSITADDQIEAAAKHINSALEVELLARVRTCDPTVFEQIVVDLLIAMGFGGGDPEMGNRIGRSGDGGIDGVIQEDALGLDAVYVQAKRYKDGNSIGSPHLFSFIGSLVGQRATKGVFVTTSSFTKDAREYVKTVQHRVVLIDGEELAKLLVRHGVCVQIDRTFVVKKLDEDYFLDE